MEILPPGLLPYDPSRYLNDLEYRRERDLELAAERLDRLKLLFSSENHSH